MKNVPIMNTEQYAEKKNERALGKRNSTSKKNFQPYNKHLHQLIRRKHRLWNRWIQTRDERKFTE